MIIGVYLCTINSNHRRMSEFQATQIRRSLEFQGWGQVTCCPVYL